MTIPIDHIDEALDDGANPDATPCQGQNCAAINGVGHSPECLFEHFMSYTGYWSQPEPVRAMLKQAYFDGIDAGKPAIVWVEKRL